jgi:hypothetical protein
MFRTDVIHLDSITKTPEGYIVSDAAVTRSGVLPYRNDDGSPRLEFRSDSEVFNGISIDTLKNKPITNNHPTEGIVTSDNFKQLAVGFTGETIRRDGNLLRCRITITDAATIAEIEAGKRELSCGYHCDCEPQAGEHMGEKYTHVQTKIRYNHIAIVNKGRAGEMVRIDEENIDSFDPLTVLDSEISFNPAGNSGNTDQNNNDVAEDFDPLHV